MGKNIVIGGKEFPPEIYQKLMNVFIEAFSHSSLSVEQAFTDIKKCNQGIRFLCESNQNNFARYQSLSYEEQEQAKHNIKYMVCWMGKKRYGIDVDLADNEDVDNKFNKYFSDLLDYIPYLVKFNNEGKPDLNLAYRDVDKMLELVTSRRTHSFEAENMKKDYINAFGYALSLDHIGIREIKDINAKVNRSDDNAASDGSYKMVNNAIPGASFETCDRKLVPTKMEELLYNYENNWGDPIEPIDYDIATTQQKHDYWNKVALREAKFHIDFERIHPFADGNGRTGRILLNTHLLKSTMAPVLITGAISKDYKKRIND